MYHVRYGKEIQQLFHSIGRLYKIHIINESQERVEYFRLFAFITECLFKFMITVYMLTGFLFFPYPLYMYYVKGEVIPLMDLYIPGIDETTFIGYIALAVSHIMYIFLGTFGISACDFVMVMLMISPLIFSKLISLDLQQVNVDLKEKVSTVFVRSRFRNIILMHQEFEE